MIDRDISRQTDQLSYIHTYIHTYTHTTRRVVVYTVAQNKLIQFTGITYAKFYMGIKIDS